MRRSLPHWRHHEPRRTILPIPAPTTTALSPPLRHFAAPDPHARLRRVALRRRFDVPWNVVVRQIREVAVWRVAFHPGQLNLLRGDVAIFAVAHRGLGVITLGGGLLFLMSEHLGLDLVGRETRFQPLAMR